MKKKIIAVFVAVFFVLNANIPIVSAVDNQEGLSLNKNVVFNKETGEYTLTTEIYTKGEVKTTVSSTPLDIILVLDQSGSMAEPFGNTTRQEAMKDAVNSFIDEVKSDDSSNGDTFHQISIVTFGSDSTIQSALSSKYAHLKGIVNSLPTEPSGATEINKGLKNAHSIASKTRENSEKLVIVFTDGAPTSSFSFFTDFSIDVANDAIGYAYKIKNDLNTKIYSVGIFDGANPNDNIGKVGEDFNYYALSKKSNRTLNYISSNSKNSLNLGVENSFYSSVTQNYDCNTSKGFYLKASSVSELNAVFESISSSVTTPSISVPETSVVRSCVSEYFELPSEFTGADVSIFTSKYNGNNSWAERVVANSSITATYNKDSKQVDVTGFDFDANCISEEIKPESNDKGSKLIIEFKIKPRDKFLGGVNLPVDTDKSGVYVDLENAEKKKIDNSVPVNTDVKLKAPELKLKDVSVYIGNKVDFDMLFDSQDDINGINNSCVTVTYEIYEGDSTLGTPIKVITVLPTGTSLNIKGDEFYPEKNKQYSVKCVVSAEPLENAETSGSSKIHILYPSLVTNDVWVDYNTNINLRENCSLPNVVWKDLAGETGLSLIQGTEPINVVFGFENSKGEIIENPFNATTDEKFSLASVRANGISYNISKKLLGDDFSVHINYYDLIIITNIDASEISKYKQDFVLNVSHNGKNYKVLMTADELLDGICTKTIKGLYSGINSNVTDRSWSWRYSTDLGDGKSVLHDNAINISKTQVAKGKAYLTIKANLENKDFLSVSDIKVNKFAGGTSDEIN